MSHGFPVDVTPKPWERGGRSTPTGVPEPESWPAYEAFRTYLEMGGGRNLRGVGRKLGKSRQQIEKWSSLNDWVARVDAWDQWLDQERFHRAGEEGARFVRRQLQLGLDIVEAETLLIREFARRCTDYPAFLRTTPADELRRLMLIVPRSARHGVALARQALGLRDEEPTEAADAMARDPLEEAVLEDPSLARDVDRMLDRAVVVLARRRSRASPTPA